MTAANRRGVGRDAALIRICAEHAVNTWAVNTSPDEMDDAHPLWVTYLHTQRTIDAAKPRTVAGMLAKARIAVDVLTLNGVVTPENGSGSTWAWDLLNDLIRLNGAVA